MSVQLQDWDGSATDISRQLWWKSQLKKQRLVKCKTNFPGYIFQFSLIIFSAASRHRLNVVLVYLTRRHRSSQREPGCRAGQNALWCRSAESLIWYGNIVPVKLKPSHRPVFPAAGSFQPSSFAWSRCSEIFRKTGNRLAMQWFVWNRAIDVDRTPIKNE